MKDYMKELEEMRTNDCGFADFYNIIISGASNLDKKEQATFLYMALNCIRDIGFKEGHKALRKDVIKYLTS